MNMELMRRIERLRADIRNSDASDRETLLDRLEDAVAVLRSEGQRPPEWARSRLAERVDEAVEDQFDNMPI